MAVIMVNKAVAMITQALHVLNIRRLRCRVLADQPRTPLLRVRTWDIAVNETIQVNIILREFTVQLGLGARRPVLRPRGPWQPTRIQHTQASKTGVH